MKVYIQVPPGHTLTVDNVTADMTIDGLKQLALEAERRQHPGVEPPPIHLYMNVGGTRQQLSDDVTLAEYGITEASSLRFETAITWLTVSEGGRRRRKSRRRRGRKSRTRRVR
jgi:hypothetical protein